MVFSTLILSSLQQEVVGQEYALTALTRAITLASAGIRRPNRPLAVLIFAGPPGSGKTHVARSLAKVALGAERKIIYINCQQLAQATDQSLEFYQQLFGGYLQSASTEPFLLDFNLIVFEEIDRAPAEMRENLAAAIERGGVFCNAAFFPLDNAMIIMTATLTRKQTEQIIGRTIGFFREGEGELGEMAQRIPVLEEIDRLVGPRLVGRSDEIVLFERLTTQHMVTLLDRKLAVIEGQLAAATIGFLIEPGAKSFLLQHGVDDLSHGVRQLNRVVRNMLEFPLADLILSRRLIPGTTVSVAHEPPKTFLNFQIMIPRLAPPDSPLSKPLELQVESV